MVKLHFKRSVTFQRVNIHPTREQAMESGKSCWGRKGILFDIKKEPASRYAVFANIGIEY